MEVSVVKYRYWRYFATTGYVGYWRRDLKQYEMELGGSFNGFNPLFATVQPLA